MVRKSLGFWDVAFQLLIQTFALGTFVTNMIISSLASTHPEFMSTSNLLFAGGGTAGCILANRLSQSPDTTVLLVERGPLAGLSLPLLSSDFCFRWFSFTNES